MRTCQSCGLQNPPDRDFCECGEYLRWEPTGYVQAITPEMAAQAAAEAAAPGQDQAAPPTPPPAPGAPAPPGGAGLDPQPPVADPQPVVTQRAAPDAPPAQGPGNGYGSGLTSGDPVGGSPTATPPPPQPPAAPAPKTAVQQAVPVPPAPPQQAAQAPPEPETARITLRHPDQDADNERTLALSVEPGQRDRVMALVRNQGSIVDNYQLRVEGMPDSWWSIYPDTVYLVPFGTGGTYEQEVEIHIHPPRAPEAVAKLWELQVVAHSKAQSRTAASAPFGLVIEPYTETSTNLRPQRAKGRRKAHYDVAVENKANAPVLVALEGEDTDDELEFGFNRPPHEIPPGQTVQTAMQVRPPKQIWIGRASERRFTVNTLTGEKAEERLAAEPTPATELEGAPTGATTKKGLFGRRRPSGNVPGVYGPRVYKPQVYKPGMQIGPSGISFRKPQITGPQFQGPQMKGMNLDPKSLKMPGKGGASSAPSGPLLPSQGVFKQKAWLPWWLVPVVLALAALAVLLYMLLPSNVAVPNVVGSKSTFEAEKKLTEAGLKLAAAPKEQPDNKAPAGSVIGQTPAAGEKAEKGEQVSVLIAVGDGKISVPKVVGMSLADAEAALRDKSLTVGKTAPTPPDPEGKIESQIPAENEIVKEGAPVDIFFADPNGKGKGKDPKAAGGAAAGAAGGAGGGGGGGGGGGEKDIVIPAIDGAKVDDYAAKLADDELVPQTKRVFDATPAGTLFATEPPGGTKAAAGDKVTLLVSAGFPQLAFDDDKNIQLVNGANGKKLDPIAKGPAREKDPTYSPDASRVAYVSGGRVFLKDMEKPDATAITLTPEGDEYSDVSWAPTADVNLIAMARKKGEDTDLCIGQVTREGMTPRCIAEPKFQIGRSIHWAPDGKTIIAFGVRQLGEFGIFRWRSKKAFSPDPNDWGAGKLVTDTSKTNEGVLDAAISPDGTRLALVSNQGGGPFQLYLGKKNDFLLTSAKPTTVRACKVAWRSDGEALVVVQADEDCQESVGSLVRLPLKNPKEQTEVGFNGDNPVFQPLTLGQ
jgi:beta-lactam-binding protein with PASTA domain